LLKLSQCSNFFWRWWNYAVVVEEKVVVELDGVDDPVVVVDVVVSVVVLIDVLVVVVKNW